MVCGTIPVGLWPKQKHHPSSLLWLFLALSRRLLVSAELSLLPPLISRAGWWLGLVASTPDTTPNAADKNIHASWGPSRSAQHKSARERGYRYSNYITTTCHPDNQVFCKACYSKMLATFQLSLSWVHSHANKQVL